MFFVKGHLSLQEEGGLRQLSGEFWPQTYFCDSQNFPREVVFPYSSVTYLSMMSFAQAKWIRELEHLIILQGEKSSLFSLIIVSVFELILQWGLGLRQKF